MRALRREAPLLLLLVYGGAFAYAAFGRGVPVFDDHPGQLFRLWHALDRSLPVDRVDRRLEPRLVGRLP